VTAFERLFGRAPDAVADAPGRVNLIGEHTDYNGGLVLPVVIPQRTRAAVAARADGRVRAVSGASEMVECALGHEARGRGWVDYVQGLTWALREAGHALRGFDLHLESTVPIGAGLASSAALEVAVLRALRAALGLALDDVALALAGQRAESEFVGARVGVMDQMAASLGEEGAALFLDTRSLKYRRIPLPAGAELAVIDSGVAHRHAEGGYNARRAECERACALLGVGSLRELDVGDLDRAARLPEPLGRRVRHVVTENVRVLAAVAALEAGDVEGLGKLLLQGHESLRDAYEVSCAEVDLLVELARKEPEVLGARLTGGGFGGAVVVLVRAGSGVPVAERLARASAARGAGRVVALVPALR